MTERTPGEWVEAVAAALEADDTPALLELAGNVDDDDDQGDELDDQADELDHDDDDQAHRRAPE